MAKVLNPGEKHVGVLIHTEDENSPYVPAQLWLDAKFGVMAEVPFMVNQPQFTAATRWFRERKPPQNLLFRGNKLNVSLFNCTFTRLTDGTYIGVSRVRAGEAVLHERVGAIDEPLLLTSLSSTIDGLADWSGLSSVRWDSEMVTGELGRRHRRVVYTVEPQDGTMWPQGDARMLITTDWRHGQPNAKGIHLDDRVVLQSRFPTPRPVAHHLAEQRKFRDLLTINLGTGGHFHHHHVRDQCFPTLMLTGRIGGTEDHQLLSRSTLTEHPHPPADIGRDFVLIPSLLPSTAFIKWARDYDGLKRVILPAVSVLRRAQPFAEDKVLSASMSIEALGVYLGPAVGEDTTYGRGNRATTATNFYRVIKHSHIDFSAIASSDTDVAKAMAGVYNTVKHADKGDFPDPVHTYYAGRIALLLVRIAVMRHLTGDIPAIKQFADSWTVTQIFHAMQQNAVAIDAAGKFA
jgi:hypothetical protein